MMRSIPSSTVDAAKFDLGWRWIAVGFCFDLGLLLDCFDDVVMVRKWDFNECSAGGGCFWWGVMVKASGHEWWQLWELLVVLVMGRFRDGLGAVELRN
ncbi:hypothetical protein V6N11_026003 [Hibiscus sabdariffa]|uniref:Transmembrane protein n=1 Tax=Hibiscus sabdariffa TaxID=183260 RepID=A0ABR2SVB4_9ROSI